jgi:NADPH-dependent 2,4-dienoyl-CoA reductase/sulfur reductase-like enzyme/rhodanese-related sulfurtransferase
MKVIIVGGVAGGASAAARLRRLDEQAQIILFEKGEFISFANCGLPYYLSHTIDAKAKLLLQTPESFKDRFNVEVRVRQEVIGIERPERQAVIRNLVTGEVYKESYDKLILAPGARAVRPRSITGADLEGVFTLRDVQDAVDIDSWIDAKKAKRAVVAGGGAIGVEIAENLEKRGLKASLVELMSHILPNIDEEMAHIPQKELQSHGIDLRLGTAIKGISKVQDGLVVETTAQALKADIVILCLGMAPCSELARDCGLKLGVRGTVCVSPDMQTSDPDIYAVGDVIEISEFITGKKKSIMLAGPANRQGRIAANSIAGIPSSYKGTQGSAIVKVYDLAVASTGMTEVQAREEGIDCDKLYLNTGAHAGYYPDAKPLTVKVIFERKTGRILGGQFIGEEGADKRCDVLAVAIRARMTASDLADLELCYAPPYSSAKDPINMAGFAIENIVSGKVRNFHWEALSTLDPAQVTLLDVRTSREYALGHVPGFINIPLNELRRRFGELDKDKPVYVHCHSGLRSYIACCMLSGNGLVSYNISGGYFMYRTYFSS